jgi:hypothetical protein
MVLKEFCVLRQFREAGGKDGFYFGVFFPKSIEFVDFREIVTDQSFKHSLAKPEGPMDDIPMMILLREREYFLDDTDEKTVERGLSLTGG